MRKAAILYKEEEAGVLSQHNDGSFTFQYNNTWLTNSSKPSISLTLPKSTQVFQAANLFPFFFNMLPEGSNKHIICKLNRIDETDYFGLLLAIAKYDSIGAVRVIKIEDK